MQTTEGTEAFGVLITVDMMCKFASRVGNTCVSKLLCLAKFVYLYICNSRSCFYFLFLD